MAADCVFCQIVAGNGDATVVFEDEASLAFLDHRPLFSGHTLVVPRSHHETLADLPADELPGFFANVQLLARAVETGMEAKGTFVGINNKVSQSVPHLHVHVVPRRPKDGLRGFFWPRRKRNEAEMRAAQAAIKRALRNLA